jgi:hypothetical protein
MYSAEEKLPYQLVTFSQSIEFHKVQPSATLNHQSEIKDHIQDVQALMPQLLDTLTMDQEPESDYHQDQEKQFQVFVELLLVLLPVEVEMKNQL